MPIASDSGETPERADQPLSELPRRVPEIAPLSEELRSLRRQLDLRGRQLERSEARFRDIIERNADAIIVVDPSGTVRFANRAATELFGAPREQLIGSMFGFPLVAGETTEVDLLIAGAPRVAEMRVVNSEWDGQDAHIASLRDVTARKRAESDARRLLRTEAERAVLEKSERKLRFLAHASAVLSTTLNVKETLATLAELCVQEMADWVVVYAINGDGRVHRMHVKHRDPSMSAIADELRDAAIDAEGSHPVLEVLRSRRSRILHELSEAELAAFTRNPRELEMARALGGGVGSSMLVPMVARDRALGAIGFVRGPESAPFDADAVTLAEDVTSRAALAVDNARLFDEAKEANQMKADFLAVVSHDLRTPLTAIIGYADLLAMGVPEPIPDGSRERVERIRASAKHLVYLLKELLAFARLDAGREEVHPAEVDLRNVVGEVAQVIEPLALERRLALVVQSPGEPVRLKTDPDKVRQILLNLAGNAVKYTSAGSVTLSLRGGKAGASIHVRDTGTGIAPQHIERIFEPFWQVDPAQRNRDGGTGLGLSVAKRLASLLGGRLTVRSELGSGSEFTLSLRGGGGGGTRDQSP